MRALILAAVMLASGNRFALELYAQLRGAAGNVVVSSFNVAQALSNIEKSAKGESAAELRRALHGASVANVPGVVSEARLWKLDFTKAAWAASRINAWASSRTHGHISSIVSAADLSPHMCTMLTSVIWMKAAWQTPFESSYTRDLPFHLSGGSDIKVPTMIQESEFRYAHAGRVRLLELPYTTAQLTMLIMLPDARDGLRDVEASLSAEQLAQWTNALRLTEMDVKLPRFTAASTHNLIAPLQHLGASHLTESASNVVHAARIEVNEEGTEASAATTATMATDTALPPPPKPFIADHPFLYIIRSGDQILFIGRVMDPRS